MIRGVALFGAFIFVLVISLSGADDDGVLRVEADVIGKFISIQVDDFVFLGNISVGQEVRSINPMKINNTGNVNISIYSGLVDQNDELFKNLYFSELASGPYNRIGGFVLSIPFSTDPDDIETESFYVKLNLKNYSGEFEEGINRVGANVKFYALAE